ncbi:PAAR domain-containing protein [Pectobacterium parmentieri]|uniref:PAAR domain-containing protein n=2 Tax=Pectobacterium parmentieri TaxID=1905730 RepID=A0ABS0S346_PECPM|nr:PAAR domain-containing protein [Pectobacterium parmentieri]AYG99894.1 PAAR domain-containing protein [Pectobacterium parmentieri]AYH04378.1 PAAR domain-containing protein [Pectobacterium parmentieri]AYH13200.1 PAAR domain-containing protein [Pectobacterium parmentieri]AYH21902.1 PAAR domain-containing protein [Pectobacterium parmentieri]AYH26132.1 PAAR domain-containing protein [Pectobacterium parmentieri]
MEMNAAIRINDPTSHGGKVIPAQSGLKIYGAEVACARDMVMCPLCKGVYPILDAPYLVSFKGKKLQWQE